MYQMSKGSAYYENEQRKVPPMRWLCLAATQPPTYLAVPRLPPQPHLFSPRLAAGQAAKSQARIDAKLAEIERSKPIDEESLLRSLDQQLAELESGRSFADCWMHVDLDAFYAAVEMRDDSSLQNVPFAVGGVGMISTANYEVPSRQFITINRGLYKYNPNCKLYNTSPPF